MSTLFYLCAPHEMYMLALGTNEFLKNLQMCNLHMQHSYENVRTIVTENIHTKYKFLWTLNSVMHEKVHFTLHVMHLLVLCVCDELFYYGQDHPSCTGILIVWFYK